MRAPLLELIQGQHKLPFLILESKNRIESFLISNALSLATFRSWNSKLFQHLEVESSLKNGQSLTLWRSVFSSSSFLEVRKSSRDSEKDKWKEERETLWITDGRKDDASFEMKPTIKHDI
jgi:hypothetical protein